MKLLLKEINGLSVVVKGENDARIQIIGLLESRTLDYENVVFLSLMKNSAFDQIQ